MAGASQHVNSIIRYSIHRADRYGRLVRNRLYNLIIQRLTTTTFTFVEIVYL